MMRFSTSTQSGVRQVATAGAVAVFVAVIAAGLSAQGGRPGRGGPGGPGGVSLPLQQLDLTEDQRTRVRDVMERYQPELQGVGERLRAAMDAQRTAIEMVPTDEGLVRSASDVAAPVQSDMAVLRAHIHGEVFAVLTPEQQAKAGEVAAQREARMEQRAAQMQNRRQQRRNRQ
jgi:protein CpxP